MTRLVAQANWYEDPVEVLEALGIDPIEASMLDQVSATAIWLLGQGKPVTIQIPAYGYVQSYFHDWYDFKYRFVKIFPKPEDLPEDLGLAFSTILDEKVRVWEEKLKALREEKSQVSLWSQRLSEESLTPEDLEGLAEYLKKVTRISWPLERILNPARRVGLSDWLNPALFDDRIRYVENHLMDAAGSTLEQKCKPFTSEVWGVFRDRVVADLEERIKVFRRRITDRISDGLFQLDQSFWYSIRVYGTEHPDLEIKVNSEVVCSFIGNEGFRDLYKELDFKET